MFTGIIESTGIIKKVFSNGSNTTFWVASELSLHLKVDQSVSHNGVCLTIEALEDNSHKVTAVSETLKKTALGDWREGSFINLERCLQIGSRLDGHLVQGHVDGVGLCKKVKETNGSWEIEFEYPRKFAKLCIEKGSICVNGISLTLFNVRKKRFSVAIVPYTFNHTNINNINTGDKVNLEFDLIGKYLLRHLSLKEK